MTTLTLYYTLIKHTAVIPLPVIRNTKKEKTKELVTETKLNYPREPEDNELLFRSSTIMTLSPCSRVLCVCVCVFCTHPAWWMCVPLLVGLAGADWVRDPESRIRCGRAFIVACRHKSGGSFVGLIKQHTEPELDAAPKSWTSAPR